MDKENKSSLKTALGTLLLIWIVAGVIAGSISQFTEDVSEKIVIIPITGPLTISESGDGLLTPRTGTTSDIISNIKKAKDDSSVKGVIFEIDSPGGTVVASEELASAVKNLKKPNVALIREVGASGAYWVASASDSIIADELSVTGSIGVLGSYLQFEGLMNKYGITYERLVGGRYKDLGSSYKELSTEEREILQKKINTIHRIFSDDVSKNRKKDLSKFSNGEFFLGIEAKEIGLIDHLGGKEKAIEVSKELASIEKARTVVFKERKSFFSSIDKYFTKYSYFIGKGISDGFLVKNEEFVINT